MQGMFLSPGTPQGKKRKARKGALKTPKTKSGESFLSRSLAIGQLPVSRQSSHEQGGGNHVISTRSIIPERFRKYSMANTANLYATLRDGHILGSRMIVKADYFPSKLKKKLDLQVSGAPNFRQVKPTPIFGVGQPNVYGIRTILNMMKVRKQESRAMVVWINLREEPIMYLNDRPFVLREMDHPFRNIDDFRGIDADRISVVENRMKLDILRESRKHYGNIMIHMELQLGEVKALWESVSSHSVQTSTELFRRLAQEGYDVRHFRIPMTAEAPPDASVLDSLADIYTDAIKSGKQVQFVFNCQRGIGRSTFGTIVMYLLQKKLHKEGNLFSLAGIRDEGGSGSGPGNDAKRGLSNMQNLDGFDSFRRGEYDIMSRLMRILKHGTVAKENVDEAIDRCGRVENLREAILYFRDRAETERQTDRHTVYLRYAADKLKRYFDLVTFGAYLHTVPLVNGKFEYTFESWLATRPGISRLSELISDPGVALKSAEAPKIQEGMMARVALGRTGTVLTKSTILKSAYFKYSRSSQSALRALRTPNYRMVCGSPLSASGQPTVSGICAILASLGAYRGGEPAPHAHLTPIIETLDRVERSSPVHVIWITLREEPIIYINGDPYVLRDYVHPFRCPPEFQAGLSEERTATLEQRLKHDIQQEAEFYGRRIVVHTHGASRALQHKWEDVPQGDAILTTNEVFEKLSSQGYNVSHYRVPLTVGEAPGLSSFDRLTNIFLEACANCGKSEGPESFDKHFAFNCQQGGRRSTVAMVVMTLLLMHKGHAPFAVCKQASSLRTDTDDTEADLSMDNASSPQMDVEETNLNTSGISEAVSGNDEEEDLNESSDFDEESSNSSDEENANGDADPRSKMQRRGEFKGILGLLRIIKHGLLVKEDVDRCIDLCGGVHNIRDDISRVTFQAENERTGQRHGRLEESIKYLESYAYLICYNAYLREHFHWTDPSGRRRKKSKMYLKQSIEKTKFSEWVSERPELLLWLDNLRKDPTSMLKVDTFATDSEYASIFENRSGNVLTRGTILKSDFFVGCKSPHLPQLVEGSVNFRGVDVFPVAGLGAPTAMGMVNAIYYFVHAQGNSKGVNPFKDLAAAMTVAEAIKSGVVTGDPLSGVWFNLREEPVLYIRNSPYVLRDFDKPYVNIENTGISTRRIEAMEKTLREDVITEAARYEGQLLLHDEDDDGNLMGIVTANITPDCVRTSKNMYTYVFDAVARFSRSLKVDIPPSLPSEEAALFKTITAKFALPIPVDIQYFRTPITDEQAPSMEMFDQIVSYLEHLSLVDSPALTSSASSSSASASATASSSLVSRALRSFLMINCQMGRGRTTTGMIVACLWSLHRQGNDLWKELKQHHSKRQSEGTARTAGHSPSSSSKPAPDQSAGGSSPWKVIPSLSLEMPSTQEGGDDVTDKKRKMADLSGSDPQHTNEAKEEKKKKKIKLHIPNEDGSSSPVITVISPEERLEQWKTNLCEGNYKMIVNLVRVLKDGDEIKKQVDLVIDHCDHMQNLRLAIFDIVERVSDTLWSKRTFYVHRGKKYLERYFFLIAFNAYFRDECPNRFSKPFVLWYKERPELQHILDRYTSQFPPDPPSIKPNPNAEDSEN